MLASNQRKLLVTNIPADAPQYMRDLIRQLNQSLQNFNIAFSNKLTFQENFNCIVTDVSFMSDSAQIIMNPVKVANTLDRSPIGCLILQASYGSKNDDNGVVYFSLGNPAWQVTGTHITILNFGTLPLASTSYNARLLIF